MRSPANGSLTESRCPECDTPFTVLTNGRPRRYCSDRCRKRADRKEQARLEGLSLAERRAAAVWDDDEKHAVWLTVLREHESLIRRILARFDALDLPAEMRGSTMIPIHRDGRRLRYRTESVNWTIASCAVAELVFDHESSKITEAMITRRVKDRLTDALRRSEEYVRGQRSTADGGRERFTDRRPPPALPPRSGAPDRTGDRAAAVADRRHDLASLKGLELPVYWIYTMARWPSKTLAGIFNRREMLQRGSFPTEAEDWTALASDGPHGDDPLAVMRAFFGELVPEDELERALQRAIRRIGEPALPEAFDDAVDLEVDPGDLRAG